MSSRSLAMAMILAALVAASGTAAAEDGRGAVYDPLPPAGSAYVRFVNALGGEVSLKPDFLPAQRLGTEPSQRVTPYAAVGGVAGRTLTLEASLAQKTGRATLKAEPGSYTTVILHRGEDGSLAATPVPDQAEFNRARARLSFYNAAPDCPEAGLGIEGGPAVFEQVAPGTVKTRSVNPVTARLRATCGSQAAPPLALEGLEAGGMYSIWLMRTEGGIASFVTRDTTARWTP